MRPVERIGGPLDSVPRVVPAPPTERRTERDARRDEQGRKGRRQPAPRRPKPEPGEGHVDVLV
jgi:hypothetical protein